jgi:hypothetical protein
LSISSYKNRLRSGFLLYFISLLFRHEMHVGYCAFFSARSCGSPAIQFHPCTMELNSLDLILFI